MKQKYEQPDDLSPENLFPVDGDFEMTIGGTTYEVSTHFDPSGRESVLWQFMTLLRKESFA